MCSQFFHPRISFQLREGGGCKLSSSTMDGPESPSELSGSHGDAHMEIEGEVWSNQNKNLNFEWAQ